MSVKLEKRKSISLVKEKPSVREVMVGLGWDVAKKGIFGGSASIDCDTAVCLIKKSGQREVVYFGHKLSDNKCVKLMGDNLTGEGDGDDEQTFIKLSEMPAEIERIVVGVNIFTSQYFKDIENAFIRILDVKDGVEICRYDISNNREYANCKSMVMGEFFRDASGSFCFRSIGEGNTCKKATMMFDEYR